MSDLPTVLQTILATATNPTWNPRRREEVALLAREGLSLLGVEPAAPVPSLPRPSPAAATKNGPSTAHPDPKPSTPSNRSRYPEKTPPELCAFCLKKITSVFYYGTACRAPNLSLCMGCGSKYANDMTLVHVVHGEVMS